MNRSMLSSVVTIAIAGLVAFGVSRWTASASSGPSLDRLENSDWLARELKLTPEQADALSKLKTDFSGAVESCCERHCAARMEIGEALFKPDWNIEKEKAAAEKLCKAQLDSELATIEHMRGVHQLLNPDQKKRYEQLVQTCFCDSCPNGLHNK